MRRNILIVILAAVLLLGLAACDVEDMTPAPAKEPAEGTSLVGTATYGMSDYDIIRFDVSDALYVREWNVGINGMGYSVLVPLLDGDGTPVTEQEYLERGGATP